MSRKTEIGQLVERRIKMFEGGLENGNTAASLARLRRGAGRTPGEIPEILGMVLQGVPECYLSETGIATREEWAIYSALTLYAVHQQGWSISMNTDDIEGVGKALVVLAKKENDANAFNRIYNRFHILASSKDIKELSYHLRGVIQLLRKDGIKLNYRKLAEDLYDFQIREIRGRMFLRWGQDLYGGSQLTED